MPRTPPRLGLALVLVLALVFVLTDRSASARPLAPMKADPVPMSWHANDVFGEFDTGYTVPPGRKFVVTDLTVSNEDITAFQYHVKLAFADPSDFTFLSSFVYVSYLETEHLQYTNGQVYEAGRTVGTFCVSPAQYHVRIAGYETDAL